LQQKNKDLSNNTISMEYLVKHLNLDKVVKNLGKPNEKTNKVENKKEKEKSITRTENSNYENTMSQGELKENEYQDLLERIEHNRNKSNTNEIHENTNENEINFDEMHKINDVDNEEEFQEKVEQLKSES
jgi:hypothetical protein